MAENGPSRVGEANRLRHVALLTVHNSGNYGSVLQSLATQKLIEGAGARCTVVDFRRERVRGDESRYFSRNPHSHAPLASQMYSMMRRRGAREKTSVFRDFLARRARISDEHYNYFEDLYRLGVQGYDAYCVGSDRVWDIEGGRGGQPFYLSFLPDDARRFSFSSFIGMRALPQDEERRVREGLSRFDGLSVREARTQEYLMSLGLEAERHVDPTLAIPSQYWRRISSAPLVSGPYIAVYQLHRNPLLVNAASRMAKITGLPRVRIDYWRTMRMPGAKAFVTPSVEEFLGLVKNASFVVTDSYHGIAFSHIFETQFAAVPPPHCSIRLLAILNRLGTDHNLIRAVEQVDAIALRWGALTFNHERLDRERQRASDYIRSQVLGA